MINLNGELLKDEEAVLSIQNRGYNYGDSLFETIRVINNEIIFWEDHYFRLMAGMRILRMEIPMDFSPEYLAEQIQAVVKESNLDQQPARVKISVHRKEGGLYKPKQKKIGYLIQASPIKDSFYTLNEKPYTVELYKDHYVQSGLLSSVKTNNRLINVLGSIYATENKYDNCLLLNEKKSVVEALNGNLFWVKGNMIKTPPTKEGCIKGITRKKLIDIIKKTAYTFEETTLSPFELQKADELFITNVIVGIRPITNYRKKEYNNTVAQELLAKLNTVARIEKSVI